MCMRACYAACLVSGLGHCVKENRVISQWQFDLHTCFFYHTETLHINIQHFIMSLLICPALAEVYSTHRFTSERL